MKKFIMMTPLQVRGQLKSNVYQPVGNELLRCERATCFPLIPVINGYAQPGEEIRVIALTPETEAARANFETLKQELSALQAEKGFVCAGPECIPITYAGDVNTQIELFRKLMKVFSDGDTLYGCLTYGNKTMPIAELMAIEYAYRVLKDVSIGCLVYGERDHSAPTLTLRVYDITALIHLDEVVRLMAELKIPDPGAMMDDILSL